MIVAKRKPLEEIKEDLKACGAKNPLIVGCGTCVAVCLTGGEKEVGLLASELAIASELEGQLMNIGEITVERQCDREFLETLRDRVEEHDVVLSLACGVGIQFLSDQYPNKVVLPGVDTIFIGANEEAGMWTERCRMCGQCYLALTGGICPITMCAKSLLNGPCGGPVGGKCEVDMERPCAWVRIYERLRDTGRLHLLEEVVPPRDFSVTRYPQTLIHKAYKKRYQAEK